MNNNLKVNFRDASIGMEYPSETEKFTIHDIAVVGEKTEHHKRLKIWMAEQIQQAYNTHKIQYICAW